MQRDWKIGDHLIFNQTGDPNNWSDSRLYYIKDMFEARWPDINNSHRMVSLSCNYNHRLNGNVYYSVLNDENVRYVSLDEAMRINLEQ